MLSTPPNHGLSSGEATRLLSQYGPNVLPRHRGSLWRLVARQFNNVLIYVLIAALALSIVIGLSEDAQDAGRFVDAIVIGAILVLNFVFGFAQEFAAERSIAALQELSTVDVFVRRDGELSRLPSAALVPGDVVLLEAGGRVPADGRILEAAHLRVDESALTGESLEVPKAPGDVAADAPLNERTNSLFSGSLLTRGTAELVVEQTGTHTELGRIAQAVGSTEIPATPLQKRLERLGRMLGLIAILMTGLVVAIGMARGMPLFDVLLIGVSLAVSAVPEGLPAVVTVCFAIGVRQMARQNALVRRLDTLETLGAVTVICSDKTGTLTENRMAVTEHWVAPGADLSELAMLAASCNRAELPDHGEPTELALLVWAAEHGGDRLPIDEEEIPFTSESSCMQTRHGEQSLLKGAPEVVAARCSSGGDELLEHAGELATRGLRVLAAATVNGEEVRPSGIWGMSDPPRAGVAEALAAAREAGVRTVMITGDAPQTAASVARLIGLPAEPALTGQEIDALPESERSSRILATSVFSRIAPLHKLQILREFEQAGEVVAMTGDGVNDAPALRGAHVGIAMGMRGTDVARAAATIVLADDHYATIVTAIAEGRRIHDNIRRFVLFLLRANFDELLVILAAFIAGLPLPLLPVHLLWINLMTDGLPALALATEAAEPGLMKRPPRDRRSSLMEGQWWQLLGATLVGFTATLTFFLVQVDRGLPIEEVRTATLTFVVLFELMQAFSSRTSLPIWRSPPWRNRWLIGAAGVVLVVHLSALYTPLADALHLSPLPVSEWIVIIPLAFVALLPIELWKLIPPPKRIKR